MNEFVDTKSGKISIMLIKFNRFGISFWCEMRKKLQHICFHKKIVDEYEWKFFY